MALKVTPNSLTGKGSAAAYAALHHQMMSQMASFGPAPHSFGSSTLRGRAPGSSLLRNFMFDHKAAMKKIMLEDSDHGDISVRYGWMHDMDQFKVTVVCNVCERRWSAAQDGPSLIRTARLDVPQEMIEREFIRRVVAPLTEEVCETSCFGAQQEAMLAEWATRRLHAAGERGMPYVQLVHEAIEARMCTPKDVDETLRKMSFISEWVTLENSGLILPGGWDGTWKLPILTLPPQHPMRDW